MGTVLVSGGTGFIGSHTCVELIEAGYDIAVFDNLSNSSEKVIDRIERICGKRPRFYQADMLSRHALESIFDNEDIEAVVHFAGFKAVGESVRKPWEYYNNNITGTLVLLDVMQDYDCKTMVFSSSATVYAGNPIPYLESMSVGSPESPYGWTKLFIERILEDLCVADENFAAVLLRYFNPIGAHPSGLIGEDPKGIPNNLMPYITQVALNKLPALNIYGNDYNTPDGTCRRDYIHVVDLAKGHVSALQWAISNTGVEAFNLGRGRPSSVLEIVNAFESVNNVTIPYKIVERRSGDLPEFWSDCTHAREELGWVAQLDLETMCRDSWNWQSNNPNGYN